jgi:hypothetical protein
MMQIAQLTYRLFEQRDLHGILSLWENFSGWGAITEHQFYEWYFKNPDGRSIIIVATDEKDAIVGQMAFIPAMVFVEGRTLKGLRASAPILNKDFRLGDLRNSQHPAFGMLKMGIDMGIKMDFDLLYSLPAHGWIGFMKLMPKYGLPNCHTADYGCITISLKEESVWEEKTGENLVLEVTNSFTDSYDYLWTDTVAQLPIYCSVIRSSSQLRWKISRHLVLEVWEDGRLLGYAAFKKGDGLLEDLLARNIEDLKKVFFTSLKAMHFKNPHRIKAPFDEIKLMVTPQITQMVGTIKFQLVKFQFAFGCCSLRPTVDHLTIDPKYWYIMPND